MSAIAIVDQAVLSAMAHHESQSVHTTYQVPATRRKNIAQGMPQLLYLAGWRLK